jgi:hypothetical protein
MGLARSPEVTVEHVDDRAVILDGAGAELITLNPVGTIVWAALDGRRDAVQLADVVLAQLSTPVDPARVVADVEGFLAELVAAGLAVDAG